MPLYFSNSGILNLRGTTTSGTILKSNTSTEPYMFNPSMALKHYFRTENFSFSAFSLPLSILVSPCTTPPITRYCGLVIYDAEGIGVIVGLGASR